MRFFKILFLGAGAAAFILAGCESESSPTENEAPTEMSILDTLADYSAWSLVTSEYGVDPAGNLGGAHGENTEVHRLIYKNGATMTSDNGEYPVGTIFLKELRMDDAGGLGEKTGAITAMIKREAGYDPAGSDWEWIMANLTLDSSIVHGNSATASGCFGCHSKPVAKDLVFSESDAVVFERISDYKSWYRVGSFIGPDPANQLQGAHGESDTVHRVVYKTPVDAATMEGSYSPGTMFLKELRADNAGAEGDLVGALTIMIKKGAGFNSQTNNWEFFMVNTAIDQVLAQGTTEVGCFSCHNNPQSTTDFVFSE